jgi:phosphoadenylyl-sulfate reductase (thioredoxin)
MDMLAVDTKSTLAEDPKLLETLEALSPEELLRWAYTEFGERAGIVTSFQDTGTVMLDMASRVAPDLRVLTIDTLRLHPETYDLIAEVERRYGVTVERYGPEPKRLQRMIDQHGEYLFFDSKAKQEFCCHVRKVEPNLRALRTLDVWITGLRRDHSDERSATAKAQYVRYDWGTILKLAPLADWTVDDVKRYIDANNVPYNSLYDQGYTSIGCVICSTPTLPNEDARAGRWRWFNALDPSKECGIHTNTSGGGI